jgi:hypothetical protein
MAALRLLLLFVFASLWPASSRAADPPACAAEVVGTLACIGERLCRCRFERGGSMVDLAPGYRWDCGPLRPTCHRPPAGSSRTTQPVDELNVLLPLRDTPLRPLPRRPVAPLPSLPPDPTG